MNTLKVKTGEELLAEYKAHRASIKHGKRWGNWTLDAIRLVLVYNENGPYQSDEPDWEGCYLGYEVDLEKCTTNAAVLDWIFQIEMHGFDVAHFVDALADLLHPQATLCSGCCSGAQSIRTLNVADHLRKEFGIRQRKGTTQ